MARKYLSPLLLLTMNILILIEAFNSHGPFVPVLYGLAAVGFLLFLWIIVSQIAIARKKHHS